MNSATAARLAAGVTTAYLRELARQAAPTAADARRDRPERDRAPRRDRP